jgi:hypothetical protein
MEFELGHQVFEKVFRLIVIPHLNSKVYVNFWFLRGLVSIRHAEIYRKWFKIFHTARVRKTWEPVNKTRNQYFRKLIRRLWLGYPGNMDILIWMILSLWFPRYNWKMISKKCGGRNEGERWLHWMRISCLKRAYCYRQSVRHIAIIICVTVYSVDLKTRFFWPHFLRIIVYYRPIVIHVI